MRHVIPELELHEGNACIVFDRCSAIILFYLKHYINVYLYNFPTFCDILNSFVQHIYWL